MLYERWRTIASERRDQLALSDFASGQQWTFGDLFTAGEGVRVGKNDIVFPQGQSVEFTLTVLAAWRTGKILCPLEPGQTPPTIGTDNLPHGIVHLKLTSATTGAPRLVALTAGQLAADAENILATMGLRSDWPNLGVISLAHSYGFSNLVTPLLLHGIPLLLAPSPLPEVIRRAAKGVSALTLPAVPAMWRAWHDTDAIPANVELAISAGAPLPLALEQAIFAKHGVKVHNFYGASECGGIAYDATESPRTDAACVGAPMKNVSLAVADDGCLEVRSRAVAEGYCWGESPEEPARNDAHCTVSTLSNGCFHTSDLAEISNGSVYLRGRAGDQINVAGRKVSPETIEQALLKHPKVSECLVFGVPSCDSERTEEIVAAVVWERSSTPAPKSSLSPRSEAWGEGWGEGQQHRVSSGQVEQTASSPPMEARGSSLREREEVLRQFALGSLPAWQAPRRWWFVESLDANERGKLSRAEWRSKFLASRPDVTPETRQT
jgi:long-chain acyl-CoA synthetase